MRFDNAEFERKSKQTMSTLEKLKSALNFDNSAKSMDMLQDSVDDMDFSPLEKGLDTVGRKFNWLDQIAIGALRRIGDQLVNTTERMAKGLSVDQISAGWGKYAAKAQSVQTIVNATGKSVEEVGEYLQYLMTFSDETSFSFTAMTQSLSTMLSTGGDIDKLTPLITGIANATAYAGKSNSEFQRSIFNLAQSYGQGYLSLIDWKSVMGAGVNSEALINKFIEVGEALGKIEKGAVSLGNFTDTLKDKWVDREVMEKAFGDFSQFSDAIIDMMDRGVINNAAEGIEQFADQFDELSVKAFVAGQEAKSFSEAVDAVKDAVSSGWMETFEIILGNYEESKTLWSTLYDGFWDIFASGASDRNRILKDAFGLTAVSELGLTLEDVEQSTGKLHRTLLKLGIPLEDFYEAANTLTGRDLLVESIQKLFEAFNKLRDTVKAAYEEIFPPITGGTIRKAIQAFHNFAESLVLSDETAEKLKNALSGIFTVADIGRRVLLFVASVAERVFSLLGGVVELLLSVGDLFGSLIITIYKTSDSSRALGSAFDILYAPISTAVKVIDSFVRGLAEAIRTISRTEALRFAADIFERIGKAIYYVVGGIGALAYTATTQLASALSNVGSMVQSIFALPISQKITGLFDEIVNFFSMLGNVFEKLFKQVSGFAKELNVIEMIFGAIFAACSAVVGGLTALVHTVNDAIRAVSKTEAFQTVVKVFTSIGDAIYYTVGAFAALFDAVSGRVYKIFSKNNKTVLRSSMSFGFLGESFTGFLTSFNEFLDKVGNTTGVQKLMTSITNLKDTLVMAVGGIAAVFPALGNWIGSFIGDGAKIESFGDVVLAVISLIAGAASKLIDIFNGIGSGVIGIVGGIIMAIGGIGDSFKNLIDTIIGKFQSEDRVNPVQATIDNVKDALAKAKGDIENFSFLDAIATGFDTLTKSMGGLSREIYSTFAPALMELKQLFGGEEAALNVIGLLELWVIMTQLTKLVGAIKKIDSEGIAEKVKLLLTSITGVFNEIKASFKWSSKMKALGKFIISFAAGVALISAAIAGLAFTISANEMSSWTAFAMVAGVMLGLKQILDSIVNLDTKKIDPKPILSLAAFFAILGGTMALLANTENVWQGMGALTAMTAAVLGLSFIFAALDNALKKNFSLKGDAFDGLSGLAKNLLQLATAMIALAIPVKLLGMMKPDEMEQGIKALRSVAVIVGLFTILTTRLSKGGILLSGKGFLGIAAGMLLIAASMKALSDVPVLRDDGSGLIAAGAALTIIGVAIAGLSTIMKFSAGPIAMFGGALLVFAFGIGAVFNAMKKSQPEKEGKSLSETFSSIGISLLRLLGAFTAAFTVAVTIGALIAAIPGAMGVIATIGTGLMAVGKKIVGFVKTLGDSIKNVGIGAVLIVASAMLISTAGSQIALGLQIMVETICKVIINTAPLISEALLTLIDSVLVSIANHADAIVASLLTIVFAILEETWKAIVKHLKVVFDVGAGGLIGALIGACFGPAGAVIGAKLGTIIGGAIGLNDELHDAAEKGATATDPLTDSLDTTANAQNKLTDAINKGTEASKAARKAVEETTSAYADQNEKLTGLVGNVFGGNVNPDLLKNAGSQMINKFGWDYMPNATSFVETYGDTLKDAAGNVMPGIGSFSVDGFVEGINDNLTDVEGAGSGIAETLLNTTAGKLAINSPSRKMMELGAYAIEGLKMGLTQSSAVGETYEAAGRLGSVVLEALRDRLKIHSPSEETMDVGDYSVQGLAKGLADNSFKAELAAGDVADATKAAVERYDEFYLAGLDNAGAYARGFASALQSGDVVPAINAAGKKYERQIDISDANDAIAQQYTDTLPSYITSEHINELYQNYLAQREAAKKAAEDAAETEEPSGYSGGGYGSSKTLAESVRERYEKQLSELSRDQQIKDLQYELWQLAYGEDANNKEWQEKHSENLASKIETQTKRVELAQQEYDEVLKSYKATSAEAVEANNRLLNEQIELQTLKNSLNDDFEKDVQYIVDKFEKDLDKIDVSERLTDAEEEKWTALYGDSAKASDIAARKSAAYTKRLSKQEERVAKVYAEYQEIAEKLGEESITAQKYYTDYLAEQNKLYELQKQSEELSAEVVELVSKRYQKSYDAIDSVAQNRDAYIDLHNSLVGDETKQIEKQQKIFDKASEAYNETVERYGKYSEEAANARKKLNVERDKLKKLQKEDEESKQKREKFEGKLSASELTEAYRDLYDESRKATLAREYYNEMVREYGKNSKEAREAYNKFAEYQTDYIDRMQVILDNYDLDSTSKTIINNLSNLLIENSEGVGKAASAVGAAIAKGLDIPESMKKSLETLSKGFGDGSFQNMLADAISFAAHMEAGDVAKAVNDGFSIFATFVDSDIGQMVSDKILHAIFTAVSSGEFASALAGLGKSLTTALTTGGIGKAITFISSGLTKLFGSTGILATAASGIGTLISGLSASLGGIVTAISGFLATLGGPAVLGIVATVAAIGVAILAAFKPDFFKKIFEMGKNIVLGLANGIKSFASNAVDAVKGVGQKIANAFRSFFGIHSPSKLFAGFGHFLMMGLGNGIEDETADVVDTVKAASVSIAETVSRAVDIANGVIENPYANQPTIRPIMDMSAIEEGRITLAEMLNSGEAVRFSADTSMNFSENASLAIADMLERQNERVIGELRLMRDDLFTMSEQFAAGINAITNMQVVLGSGELVGGIGNGMNEYLGMQTVLDGRNV